MLNDARRELLLPWTAVEEKRNIEYSEAAPRSSTWSTWSLLARESRTVFPKRGIELLLRAILLHLTITLPLGLPAIYRASASMLP